MKRDRREVLALRREVKRLRKQLSRHETAILEEKYRAEENEERKKEKQKKDTKKAKEIGDRCIKCNAPAEVLDLGRGGIYRICTDRARCWHRQKLK